MNYLKIYNNLIQKAQLRIAPNGYVEKHHILPKSLGGSDDLKNLVTLTAREHFLAHLLLAKHYGGTQWTAVVLFKTKKRTYLNSRLYEKAKTESRKALSLKKLGKKFSDETKKKMSSSQKGRILSAESKLKISLARKLNPSPAAHKLAMNSKEIKEKISSSLKNRIVSDDTRRKQSEIRMGKTTSEKHKLSMQNPEGKAKRIEGVKMHFFKKRCVSLNTLIDSVFV